MALTAAEKRARRAQAATEQRKAEADRGKRRRAQQREVTKQHDRDRRQRRRKEIMWLLAALHWKMMMTQMRR